jgi:cytochrome c556
MRGLGVRLIGGMGLLATAALAQAPTTFQPVGNMSQLMIDIIYPTSDAIFYVDRDPPKNEHDWNVLRGQALTLAESGNLLMMEGRARDQQNWITDSKMLVTIGAAAFKAAQAKNLDGIRALNDQLNAACVTCHYQYRPGYHRRK